MSDKPYQKECVYCKNKILMSKESGNWLPYNLNNGPHDCRNRGQKQEPTTQHEQKNHKEITLEMVLKKLESIGIKVNLEELFK